MAILSRLVFGAPSDASCTGVFAWVTVLGSCDSGRVAGVSEGVVSGGVTSSGFFVAAADAAGVDVFFFWPAFAAASAPACLIAIDMGDSFLLTLPSFFLSFSGSLIEICLVSDAVLACEDPPALCAFARSAAAACASAEVELTGTSPNISITASSSSSSSPYSFHSSICSRS